MRRALLLAALFAVEAAACIWTDRTDLRGNKIKVEGMSDATMVLGTWRPEQKFWIDREKELRSDPAQRNDYAAVLMHLGRAAAAVPILEKLEREQPGKYATAANLGTAYELTGKDAEALRWIREGIRRDKNAHDGTEWLHARILEVKLALAGDPKWLEKSSVLGLDFGNGPIPLMPKKGWPANNTGKPAKADAVRHAISFQLHERLEFVPPPEPVVGDLLFDLANLWMLTRDLESAELLFAEAIRYGAPRTELAKRRQAYIRGFLGDRGHGRK